MGSRSAKQIINKIVIIGYYQIVGGVIGLALVLWAISGLLSLNTLVTSVLCFVILLFALSIFSGILLMKSPVSGINLSIINQCLQLFSFSLMGYSYQFCSGIFLNVGIDLTDSFLLLFNLGISSYQLNIGTDQPNTQLELNFIAAYLIVLLADLKSRIRKEKNQRLVDGLISSE